MSSSVSPQVEISKTIKNNSPSKNRKNNNDNKKSDSSEGEDNYNYDSDENNNNNNYHLEPQLQREVSKIIELEQVLAFQISELLASEQEYREKHASGNNSNWIASLSAQNNNNNNNHNEIKIDATNNNNNNNNNNTTTRTSTSSPIQVSPSPSLQQQQQQQQQQVDSLSSPNALAANSGLVSPQQQQVSGMRLGRRRSSTTTFLGLPPIGEPDHNNNHQQQINNISNTISTPTPPPVPSLFSAFNNNIQNIHTTMQQQQQQQLRDLSSSSTSSPASREHSSMERINNNNPVNNATTPNMNTTTAIVALPSALQNRPSSAASVASSSGHNGSVTTLNNTTTSLQSVLLLSNNNNNNNKKNGKDETPSNAYDSSLTTNPFNNTTSPRPSSALTPSNNLNNNNTNSGAPTTKSVTFFGTSVAGEEIRKSSFVNLRRLATATTVKLIRTLAKAIIFDFAAQSRGEMSILPLNLDPTEMRARLKILTSTEFCVNKLRFVPLSDKEIDGKTKFDFEDEIWREKVITNNDSPSSFRLPENNTNSDGGKTQSAFSFFSTASAFSNVSNNNQNNKSIKRRKSNILHTTKAFEDFEADERSKGERKISEIDAVCRLALTNMKQTDWYDPKFEISLQKRTQPRRRDSNASSNDNFDDDDDDYIMKKLPIPPKGKFEGVAESSIRHKREQRANIAAHLRSNHNNANSNENLRANMSSIRLPTNPSIDAVWAQVFFQKFHQNNSSVMNAASSYNNNTRGDENHNNNKMNLFSSSASSSSGSNWSGEPIPRPCRCDEAEHAKYSELQEKRRRVSKVRQHVSENKIMKKMMEQQAKMFFEKSGNNNNLRNGGNNARGMLYLTHEQKEEARRKREEKQGKFIAVQSFGSFNRQRLQKLMEQEEEAGNVFADGDDEGSIPFLPDKKSASTKNNNIFSSSRKSGVLPESSKLDGKAEDKNGNKSPERTKNSSLLLRTPQRPASSSTNPRLNNNNKNPVRGRTASSSSSSKNNQKGKTSPIPSKNQKSSKTSPPSSSPIKKVLDSTTKLTTRKRSPSPHGNNNNTNSNNISSSSSSPHHHQQTTAVSILAASAKYRHVRYRRRHVDAVTVLATWWRGILACRSARKYCAKYRATKSTASTTFQRFGRAFIARKKLYRFKTGIVVVQKFALAKIGLYAIAATAHREIVVQRFVDWQRLVTFCVKRFLARRQRNIKKKLLDEYTEHRLDLERNDDEVVVITLQWRYDTLLHKLCTAWGVADSSWKKSALGALNSVLEDKKNRLIALSKNNNNNNKTGSKFIYPMSPISPFERQRRKSLVRFSEIGIGNEELNSIGMGSGLYTSISSNMNNDNTTTLSQENNGIHNNNNNNQQHSSVVSLEDTSNSNIGGSGSFNNSSSGSGNNFQHRRSSTTSGTILGLDGQLVLSSLSPSMRLAAVDAVKRARVGATLLKHKQIRFAIKIQKVFRGFWARKFIVTPLREVMAALEDFKNSARLRVHIHDKLAIRENKREQREELYIHRRLNQEAHRLKNFWSPVLFGACQEDDEGEANVSKVNDGKKRKGVAREADDDDESGMNRFNPSMTKSEDLFSESTSSDDEDDENDEHHDEEIGRNQMIANKIETLSPSEAKKKSQSPDSNRHSSPPTSSSNGDSVSPPSSNSRNNNNNNNRHHHHNTKKSNTQKNRKRVKFEENDIDHDADDDDEDNQHDDANDYYSYARARKQKPTHQEKSSSLDHGHHSHHHHHLLHPSPSTRRVATEILHNSPGIVISAAKLSQIEAECATNALEKTRKMKPSSIDFLVQNQLRKDVADPERRSQYHRFLATETRFFQEHQKLPVVSKM